MLHANVLNLNLHACCFGGNGYNIATKSMCVFERLQTVLGLRLTTYTGGTSA